MNAHADVTRADIEPQRLEQARVQEHKCTKNSLSPAAPSEPTWNVLSFSLWNADSKLWGQKCKNPIVLSHSSVDALLARTHCRRRSQGLFATFWNTFDYTSSHCRSLFILHIMYRHLITFSTASRHTLFPVQSLLFVPAFTSHTLKRRTRDSN